MKDYGIATVTVLGPAFIIGLVVLFAGGIGLWLTGYLNAVIYLFAGIGFLWVASFFGLFRHPLGWLFAAVTLIIMPLWGWGIDNISWLSIMPNPANWIMSSPTLTLATNELTGESLSFELTLQIFSMLVTIVGIIVGSGTIYYSRKRKHR
jgi:hypothetical protein